MGSKISLSPEPSGVKRRDIMNSKIAGPQLVKLAEATEILRVSRATIYRLQKTDPNFPRILKVGRSSQFRLSDLESYVDQAREI